MNVSLGKSTDPIFFNGLWLYLRCELDCSNFQFVRSLNWNGKIQPSTLMFNFAFLLFAIIYSLFDYWYNFVYVQ